MGYNISQSGKSNTRRTYLMKEKKWDTVSNILTSQESHIKRTGQ